MSTQDDMRERHSRVLAELAETGMVMVRRLSASMLATDDLQIQAQVGLAYHRVSRAVRLTLALEYRLSQEPRAQNRTAAAPARASDPAPAPPAPPRLQPERISWNEYESDDSDEGLDELDALLSAEEVDVEAVREAVETSIVRLRHDIAGIRAPAARATATVAARLVAAPAAPAARRSHLMGGAALARPLIATPGAGVPLHRSSA